MGKKTKCLGYFHVDDTGSILWEQTYFSNDTLVKPDWSETLTLTPENKYLITGTCYTPDSGQVNPQWSRPMIILADSSGETVWEIPWMLTSQYIGEGFQSIWSGNKVYSAISKYARSPDTTHSSPCLIVTSSQGSPVMSKKIIESTDYGKATTITRISDSSFFLGGCYDPGYYLNPTLSVFNVDPFGNVRKEKVLSHTVYIPKDAIITQDNKYLITANDQVGDNFVIKLWKLNLNLDYDSIYTRPFTYDSLCPSSYYFQHTFLPVRCGGRNTRVGNKHRPG